MATTMTEGSTSTVTLSGHSPASAGSNSMPTAVATMTPAQLHLPSSSTFSFKAPFPPSAGHVKQRRVSMALPSSPKLISSAAWDFRDDTSLNAHRTATPVFSSGKVTPNGNAGGHGYDTDTDALTPARRGKMRRIASDADDEPSGSSSRRSAVGVDIAGLAISEKKPRKRWTDDETQMLVRGCQKHGVGNWKTILSDKTLQFDDRSPVDLKDRFRTYFPDAYKTHYPNARTHLSSKVQRATLPDGTNLFEKSRSKKRRPFTEQEDKALKEGYEKHGTVWATIVKNPVFQEQGRRSTDLRDRFRNAFPDLYQAAGYKPRAAVGKKKEMSVPPVPPLPTVNLSNMSPVDPTVTITASTSWTRPRIPLPTRSATDDQLTDIGPVRRRRRAMLRGGSKSVPQSTAVSEDELEMEEDSDDDEVIEQQDKPAPRRRAQRATFSSGTGPRRIVKEKKRARSSSASAAMTFASASASVNAGETAMDLELDLGSSKDVHPSLSSSSDLDMNGSFASHSHSGLDTPVHGHATWSPTSSHLSTDLLTHATPAMEPTSPFARRSEMHNHTAATGNGNPGGGDGGGGESSMIGKSAWGTQDWFSAKPRLDPSSSTSSISGASSNTSFTDLDIDIERDSGFSPASPFSFNHLNHGVLDRYDLFPTTSFTNHHSHSHSVSHASSPNHMAHHQHGHHHLGSLFNGSMDERQDDFASVCSDAGFGDRDGLSTFSDDLGGPGYSHTGFKGFTHHSSEAGDLIFGARTHQPQQGYYGMSALGLGLGLSGSFGFGMGSSGFGLSSSTSGMDMATDGMGDLGLGLDLDGGMPPPPPPGPSLHPMQMHQSTLPGIDEIELTSITLDDHLPSENGQDQTMSDITSSSFTSKDDMQALSSTDHAGTGLESTARETYELTSIEDILDLSQHDVDPSGNATPPGTPLSQAQGRPSSLYQRAMSAFGTNPFQMPSNHGRSISVPPSEARSSPARPPATTDADTLTAGVDHHPHRLVLRLALTDLTQTPYTHDNA
ncbi:hypothetical protein HGRIS_007118 [Hohenbuehelia grisea]|uniref:Meiotically up-regulated gene 152 protein n=1 Tax=Hohenbuehelia grisea TaxID=104357 RepID=A0ABR3JCR2_9AGAR